MKLYEQEFNENFDIGFDLEDHPYLIDKSWHNDQCPSFYFPPVSGSDSYTQIN
ncbi:hypothetical protein J5X91_13420 [Pseudoalteromonas sp. K222D]|uniref:hypothetical protein n=1 Tax=Pseudoalteromonas sp. K222D TaxID=2820756 RepID=UPI001AD6C0F2|nr:hypothetical protein [Pseudoalteromonas sp. K222D]MBO7927249.1 hypothetical protein [Pseudoalteromonas sp. K222D]